MRVIKWVLAVAGVLVAVLGAGVLWVWQSSLPQLEGTLAAPGLTAQVKIIRDTDAVPHIYAGSIGDAVYALGFTHAQERGWQMEMQRRIAAGRLAELLGAGALETDKFLRTLGIARRAQAALAEYDAPTRDMLARYAQGVNAAFALGRISPEARILQTPPPEPWTPADTVGWTLMMAWDLGGNWASELNRLRLSSVLDKAAIDRLLLPYPGDAPIATRDYTTLYRELGVAKSATTAVSELLAAAPGGLDRLSADLGSNNWVVHGQNTQSGKPILANDPHLSLGTPSLWYLAHLNAPGLNVIGATLPGVPFVLLGRNDHIAWGFTNTGPDVQDLYLERIDPANLSQYQTPQGMQPFAVRTERIKVKGQEDVLLTVRETRHGPVISDVSEAAKKALAANSYVLAFRWTALQPGDLTVQAGMGMNLAKNWPEFLAAVRNFHAPQQNMVFADVEGNIGYIAPGRVPLRSKENDLSGLAPAPGWEARYDWAGWIPFEELPQRFQAAQQTASEPWIATANQKVTPPGYPHLISSDWALPYRAQRIESLLAATPKHTPQTLAAIQTDDVSLAMQTLLPHLRAVKPNGEREKRAVALLESWNGVMAPDRAEPAIAVAWWREAMRQTFSDELAKLWPDIWTANNLHQALLGAQSGKPEQAPWCDIISTPAKETCADILAASLPKALETLEQIAGKDMNAWKWGTIHAVRAEHRPFGRQAQLAKVFDITIPVGGDRFTVNQTAHNMKDDPAVFNTRHGAGYRAVYDMANPDGGSFIHTSGQSGNVFSERYQDYAKLWGKGERIAMRLSRAAVENSSQRTLLLNPLPK
ncbi:MAG: penicillin acylase family protein [Burkholderiaceae bacterium]